MNSMVKAWPEFNLVLNSSFLKFLFADVSKYLNFATISKDLLAIFM
jgi:hypothetical protein